MRYQCLVGLPKTHVTDAWCIAASRIDIANIAPSIVTNVAQLQHYEIKQFRRQNRAIINHQRERTYKYNGHSVAKNRHKRFDQKMDSLEEWYAKQVALYGVKEAEKMRSQIKVTKSTRYYNTSGRIMPGAIFIYDNRRHVLVGQNSHGRCFNSHIDNYKYISSSKCKIVLHNTGLVYL